MTRLDKAIRRLEAQRALLDQAIAAIAAHHGPQDGWLVELGLGNGRTYHHLCQRLPAFRVIGFERLLVAHPSSIPREADLVLGEIAETVPLFVAREGARALLVHADLGNGVEADDRVLEQWLPGAVAALSQTGAIVLSSTQLRHPLLAADTTGLERLGYEYYRYALVAR